MAYAALSLLALLCLVSCLSALGLIRRVRDHDVQLAQRSRIQPLPGLPAGNDAPDFTVTTVTGTTRSLSDVTRGSRGVVVFLTPDCAPCRAQVLELQRYAAAVQGGASDALAVVCGTPDESAWLVDRLKDAVSVVVERARGPLQQAFAVTEYPVVFAITDQGRIRGRGPSVATLTARFEAANGSRAAATPEPSR